MSWPTALVVTVALIVLGTLAVLGVDTSNLTFVLLTVLGGLGVGELKAIKDQTNGSQKALLEEVAQHRQALTEIAKSQTIGPFPLPENGSITVSAAPTNTDLA